MAEPFLVRDPDRRRIVGMIHVPALPGSPRSDLAVGEIIDRCRQEAALYASSGIDGIAIENMHDRPYLKGAAPAETVSTMTAVACAVRSAAPGLPCGIQILAGANREALAVAAAADLAFIRAEGFVFAHVGDEGLIESDAGELLRYRRRIGAEDVQILTDIRKKHSSHAITADIDLAENARAAEFFLSDALVVTGSRTGNPPEAGDLQSVRAASRLPVVLGSGLTVENASSLLPHLDAAIVGSAFKTDGHWENPLDPSRIEALLAAASA